ncbi:phosphatase PAP2 family protein [Calothrix sp. PCC 7507]|uniref:phosphatase PAP2 family protein n=1 Tax=Calothrix sp. PCC 7507 TaxID=99598 RepID=UPI00029F2A30|nr:phosphatase PAP2 family protein [Calothrix sp. PCC 7507]AFY31825.1 phosphoesterase PA-phosphatase related protein [Calothrix sp. PCC 7507]
MDRGKKVNQERNSPLSFLKNLLIAHWRSLLLLLIGVYLPLQMFGLLALEVRENQAGFPWDLPILLGIHSLAQPQLDMFAVVLTRIGSFWTAFPILSAIALLLWQRKKWRSLTYLITTGLGSAIINRTTKEIMHRVRPQLWESLAPEFDYAFPSGHAMTSMTLVMILIILAKSHPWRGLVVIFGGLYVLAIAWTRLYLGVHFPSDILAGWMVAIAWAIGVSIIIKPNLTPAKPIHHQTGDETSLLPEEETQLSKR